MIKQNNLSLKSLKAQLDALTKDKKAIGDLPTPNKSRFGSLPLFIFTTILTNLDKIPGVSKLTKVMKLWYGRTTWWKILVQVRKAFIVFNALIGLYAVIKITGFSPDNLLAGFVAMGAAYFEMLGNLLDKLFGFFLRLFDRVTPDPKPQGGWSWPWSSGGGDKDPRWFSKGMSWNTKPMNPNSITDPIIELSKTQKFYNPFSPTTTDSSWFNIPKWLWYTGIALISVGVLFLGYKVISDPTWITPYKSGRPPIEPSSSNPDIVVDSPPIDPSPSGGIGSAIVNTTALIASKLTAIPRAIAHALNPFTYLPTPDQASASYRGFIERQFDPVVADRRYYPFTVVNPFDSATHKWSLALFGESASDYAKRMADLEYANRLYDQIKVSLSNLASGARTPVTGLGIGVNSPLPGTSALEIISAIDLENKLKSLPLTPQGTSLHLPVIDDMALGSAWADHIKADQVAAASKIGESIVSTVTPQVSDILDKGKAVVKPEIVEVVKSSIKSNVPQVASTSKSSLVSIPTLISPSPIVVGKEEMIVATTAAVAISQVVSDLLTTEPKLEDVDSHPSNSEQVQEEVESSEEGDTSETINIVLDDVTVKVVDYYRDYFKGCDIDSRDLVRYFRNDLEYAINESVETSEVLTSEEKQSINNLLNSVNNIDWNVPEDESINTRKEKLVEIKTTISSIRKSLSEQINATDNTDFKNKLNNLKSNLVNITKAFNYDIDSLTAKIAKETLQSPATSTTSTIIP